MNEITTQTRLVNPVDGDVLTLDSPTVDLGRFLAAVRDHETDLREAKRLVTQELLARMDRTASWTIHVDEFKISGASPAPVEEWDGIELRTALLALVDEGVLSIEAVDAAVETVVTYKPVRKGINALRKLGGRVADTVNGLARESERDRRVTVSAR